MGEGGKGKTRTVSPSGEEESANPIITIGETMRKEDRAMFLRSDKRRRTWRRGEFRGMKKRKGSMVKGKGKRAPSLRKWKHMRIKRGERVLAKSKNIAEERIDRLICFAKKGGRASTHSGEKELLICLEIKKGGELTKVASAEKRKDI